LHLVNATFFVFVYIFEWGFTMFYIVFRVRKAILICVSLKSYVIIFICLPLSVKVARLVFWCCGSMFLLCLCWLWCLVPSFILYSLLCSVSFMFSYFSSASFVIGYMCADIIAGSTNSVCRCSSNNSVSVISCRHFHENWPFRRAC
jgi:hypothetical protein